MADAEELNAEELNEIIAEDFDEARLEARELFELKAASKHSRVFRPGNFSN